MTLISIIGDVGSGKTLFATYLATKDERPIYSNYKLKLKNYHDLKPEMLVSMNKPSLVIIDEAYTWLESRTSGKDINRYLSYILFQSRKRGMDIILTDQLIGTIDVRFRLLTNYEIFAENDGDNFIYRIYKKSAFNSFKPLRVIMPYEVAEKLFSVYDSWELINPIDDNLIFNVAEDKSSSIKEVDRIVSVLLKKFEPEEISKGIVSNHCIRHNYPNKYIDLIYNSILEIRAKKKTKKNKSPH